MRGETEGADSAAECRKESYPGSNVGHHIAVETYKEAVADLGVHEVLTG